MLATGVVFDDDAPTTGGVVVVAASVVESGAFVPVAINDFELAYTPATEAAPTVIVTVLAAVGEN
jgi:hypothetical protein